METRDRIVRCTADLVFRHTAAGASIDQVLAASGVSRSQLSRHFADRELLLEAVVDFQIAEVLAGQSAMLSGLDSLQGLRAWADDILAMNRAQERAHGCPLGSLVSQLAEQPGTARVKLEAAFRTWQSYLAAVLCRMQDRCELDSDADVAELATGIMALLQGGLILAQAARSEEPLRAALDLAVGRVALATTACSPGPAAWETTDASDAPASGAASLRSRQPQ